MEISAALHTLKPTHQFGISREVRTEYQTLLIRITHDSHTGYGDAFPSARYESTAEENLDTLRSADLTILTEEMATFRPAPFQRKVERAVNQTDSLCAGLTGAYYDLHARRLCVPAAELVGSAGLSMPVSSYTIGLDDPEVMRQKVREAEEYPLLKVKLGTDRDEEIIQTIRSETDKPVRVDANEGWNAEEALRMTDWLAGENVEFVEQPIPAGQYDEMRWLRARSPLPLIADEDCRHVEDLPLILSCYDGINIKLVKCGGITPALKMIHTARTFQKTVMLGCMVESSAGIAAATALGSQVDYLDLDGNLLLSNDPFSGPRAEGGHFPELTTPGLGIEPLVDIDWQKILSA